jgi:hypothetical protein
MRIIREAKADDELTLAVLRTRQAKANSERAESIFKEEQAALIKIIEARGDDYADIETPDGPLRARIRTSELMKFNEAGLKKALGARAFNKLTKPAVLDKKKLEDAIVAGTVDPILVSQYAETKLTSPYIQFSEPTTE